MNKPKIRFKGYTDAWERRKLGEIAEITMGQSPNGNTYFDFPCGYILVQGNADLKDGWVFPRIWTTQKTKIADAGDLIMSVRAPAGAMGKTAYRVVLGRGVAGIKGNEFLFQILSKLDADGYWKKLSCGSTFESLNSNNINEASVNVSSSQSEQAKIGAFFRGLDELIALHQRKYEKLQKVKKSFLEKMFPTEGESKPRIRFKGYTDAWERRKLGEIANRRNIVSTKDEKLPRVEYEDINSGAGTLNKNINEKESSKIGVYFQKGDILFGKLRPYLKNWLLPNFSGIAVGDFWVLNPNNSNSGFVYTLIQSSNFQRVANMSTGTKMPRSDWSIVSVSDFAIPSDYSEQAKIGAFFRGLDELIALHQRKRKHRKKTNKC